MLDDVSLRALDNLIIVVDEGFSDGIVSIPETGLEDVVYRVGLAGWFRDHVDQIRGAISNKFRNKATPPTQETPRPPDEKTIDSKISLKDSRTSQDPQASQASPQASPASQDSHAPRDPPAPHDPSAPQDPLSLQDPLVSRDPRVSQTSGPHIDKESQHDAPVLKERLPRLSPSPSQQLPRKRIDVGDSQALPQSSTQEGLPKEDDQVLDDYARWNSDQSLPMPESKGTKETVTQPRLSRVKWEEETIHHSNDDQKRLPRKRSGDGERTGDPTSSSA